MPATLSGGADGRDSRVPDVESSVGEVPTRERGGGGGNEDGYYLAEVDQKYARGELF